MALRVSARNQLSGSVRAATLGAVMAEVMVDVDPGVIVAAITRGSAESLSLKAGDTVTVMIKATDVMIAKERRRRKRR